MSKTKDPIADLRRWDYCWPGNVNLECAVQEAILAYDDLTRRLAEVTAERDAGRELMRQAWRELNAIRARAGAPEGVSHEWFDQLVTGIADCLGDDRVPWMTRAAKAIVRPYEARAETAEAALAHAESERDTAYREASERYKAFVALEAALSARDEALRVAREAIDEIARQMTAAEATVLVPNGEPDFEGGYDRCVARARDAQDAIDALTKPQEAGE